MEWLLLRLPIDKESRILIHMCLMLMFRTAADHLLEVRFLVDVIRV